MNELKLMKELKKGNRLGKAELKHLAQRFKIPLTYYSTYLTKSELANNLSQEGQSVENLTKEELLAATRKFGEPLRVTKRVPSYSSIKFSHHMRTMYPSTWRAAEFAFCSNLSSWFGDQTLFAFFKLSEDKLIDKLTNHLKTINYPDEELIKLIQNHGEIVMNLANVINTLQMTDQDQIHVYTSSGLTSRNTRKIIHSLITLVGYHSNTLYNHNTITVVKNGQIMTQPYNEKIGVLVSKIPLALSRRKRHRKFHGKYVQQVYRSRVKSIIDATTDKIKISSNIKEFRDVFYASL